MSCKFKGIYFGNKLVSNADDIVACELNAIKREMAYTDKGSTTVIVPDDWVSANKTLYENYISHSSETFNCSIVDNALILENPSANDGRYKYESADGKTRIEFYYAAGICHINIRYGSSELELPIITSIGNGKFAGSDYKWIYGETTTTLTKLGDFEGTYEFEYGSCYFKLTSATGDIGYSISGMVNREYELSPSNDKETTKTYYPVLKTINYAVIGSDGQTAISKAQTYITDSTVTTWAEDTLQVISSDYIAGIYSNADCTRSVMGKEILDEVQVYVKLKKTTADEYNVSVNNIFEDDPTGEVTVISSTSDLVENPLTLEAIEAGTITVNNPEKLTIIYVKNGKTKTTSSSSMIFIPVANGDTVSFYGDNAIYGTHNLEYSTHIACDGDCYLYGNIMSLINSTEAVTEFPPDTDYSWNYYGYTFSNLFKFNSRIKNHSLKTIELPAMTLKDNCYNSMFYECTGLTVAPELSSTTLTRGCYEKMFYGCTGLTKAPELLAEQLTSNCYSEMFYGCTNLKYIKCLAKEFSSIYGDSEESLSSATLDWVKNVSTSGKFITSDASVWEDGKNGIPLGWTIETTSGTVIPPKRLLGGLPAFPVYVPANAYSICIYRNDKHLADINDFDYTYTTPGWIQFVDSYVTKGKSYTYQYKVYSKYDENEKQNLLFTSESIGAIIPTSGYGELNISLSGGKTSYDSQTGVLTIEERPTIRVSPDTGSKLYTNLYLQEVLDSGDWSAQSIWWTTVNLKSSWEGKLKGKTVTLNWTVHISESAYSDFSYNIDWTPENNKFSGAEYGLPDSVVIPE